MIFNNQAPSAIEAARLSGVRKAAIVTIILGEQVASDILRLLDEREVEEIGKEVARIQSISNSDAENVLEECYQMAVAHEYVIKGGVDYARKMLLSAFGPDQGTRMLDRLLKSLGD